MTLLKSSYSREDEYLMPTHISPYGPSYYDGWRSAQPYSSLSDRPESYPKTSSMLDCERAELNPVLIHLIREYIGHYGGGSVAVKIQLHPAAALHWRELTNRFLLPSDTSPDLPPLPAMSTLTFEYIENDNIDSTSAILLDDEDKVVLVAFNFRHPLAHTPKPLNWSPKLLSEEIGPPEW